MVSGLTGNTATYPAPPAAPVDLGALVSAYTTANNASIAAQAATEDATGSKDDALEDLVDAISATPRIRLISMMTN